MGRKGHDVTDPQLWLSFAKSDLLLAQKGNLPEVRLEGLCYLAQQAAEKALKALLIHRRVHFSKTHDIKALFSRLPVDLLPPPVVQQAVDLSDYAYEGRYPQNFEDVKEKEYRLAVKKAEAVLQWVEKAIQSPDDFQAPFLHESPAKYRAGKARIKKRRRK